MQLVVIDIPNDSMLLSNIMCSKDCSDLLHTINVYVCVCMCVFVCVCIIILSLQFLLFKQFNECNHYL